MNNTQKQYELKSRMYINKTFGQTDFFKYIDTIKSRENKYYLNNPQKTYVKKIIYEPYKDINVIESNRRHKTKIFNIIDEPVFPKLNRMFLEIREKMRNSKEKCKIIADRNLSLENSKFQDRIFSQKSRIDELNNIKNKIEKEKEFIRRITFLRHSKTKEFHINDKIQGSTNDLKLPNINKQKEKEKEDKIFQTEINTNKKYYNEETSENLKEHKYKDVLHQKQGHIK